MYPGSVVFGQKPHVDCFPVVGQVSNRSGGCGLLPRVIEVIRARPVDPSVRTYLVAPAAVAHVNVVVVLASVVPGVGVMIPAWVGNTLKVVFLRCCA